MPCHYLIINYYIPERLYMFVYIPFTCVCIYMYILIYIFNTHMFWIHHCNYCTCILSLSSCPWARCRHSPCPAADAQRAGVLWFGLGAHKVQIRVLLAEPRWWTLNSPQPQHAGDRRGCCCRTLLNVYSTISGRGSFLSLLQIKAIHIIGFRH